MRTRTISPRTRTTHLIVYYLAGASFLTLIPFSMHQFRPAPTPRPGLLVLPALRHPSPSPRGNEPDTRLLYQSERALRALGRIEKPIQLTPERNALADSDPFLTVRGEDLSGESRIEFVWDRRNGTLLSLSQPRRSPALVAETQIRPAEGATLVQYWLRRLDLAGAAPGLPRPIPAGKVGNFLTYRVPLARRTVMVSIDRFTGDLARLETLHTKPSPP